MTPERWQEVKKVLAGALERTPEQRSAYLDEACREPSLRREVESLLVANDETRDSLLRDTAAQVGELTTGSMLGPYEILARIGAGGMGVVYRARDTRLKRTVAVKVLPREFSADPRGRERFAAEARAVSSLSHPHICVLYDIGSQDGRDYLVMEYLEGETLADRLSRNRSPDAESFARLPFETIVRFGAQISDALAHAHSRNILHRDLKTSNVMVIPEDRVKVLDFGLAKLMVGPDATTAAAGDYSLTLPGEFVGTMYASAPEILRGNVADVRSDVWALGVVLYEMAAGRRPFQRKTNIELIASVLGEAPAPMGAGVPADLQLVISRCLEKEPEKRFQGAAEVRRALETLQASAAATITTAERPARKLVVYAGVALLVLAAGIAAFLSVRSPRRQPAIRYEQITNFSDSVASPALSPDGRMLAFIHGQSTFDGPGDIWVKLLPNGEPVQLTHDASGKLGPAFSPDGSQIAYTSTERWNWDTWTVPSLGGTPERWLPNASGLTWISNQQVLFSEIESGLYMKVVAAGQNRDGERDVYLPPSRPIGMAHRSYVSPDHKWILVTEMDSKGWLPCRLVPFSGGAPPQTVGPAPSKCTGAAWSPDEKWMYFSADAGTGFHLWRQQFPAGTPEQITFGATEEEGIAVAPDGKSLVTAIGSEQSSIYLQEPGKLRQITSQGYAYSPSISADGKRIYYLLRTDSSRAFVAGEFRAAELATGHSENLLPGFSVARYDVSSDGERVVFAAMDTHGKSSVWLASLTHSFPPKRLTQREAYRPFFASGGAIYYLGDDDQRLYVFRMNEDGSSDGKVLRDPVIYLIAVSPDGQQLVAWIERSDPRSTTAVAIYPASGGKAVLLCARCSATGPAYTGSGIVSWSPDEKFLYFRVDLPGMSSTSTFVIPLTPGHALPNLPPNGFESADELKKIPGVREIPETDVFPGRDPTRYAISRTTTQRNLYRVWLP
jgi:eukaryotic-like serine/threonine-protein kinase